MTVAWCCGAVLHSIADLYPAKTPQLQAAVLAGCGDGTTAEKRCCDACCCVWTCVCLYVCVKHSPCVRVCITRRIVQVCDLEVAPPSLEAIVINAAARLLHHYVPDTSGPLRQQPLVQKALQLTALVVDVGAADGRSPWVGAGEVGWESW